MRLIGRVSFPFSPAILSARSLEIRTFQSAIEQNPQVWRDKVSGLKANALKGGSTGNAVRSSANYQRKLPSRRRAAAAIRTATRACAAPYWQRAPRACPMTTSNGRSNAAPERAETANSSMKSLMKVTPRVAWPSWSRQRQTAETARERKSGEFSPRTTATLLRVAASRTCSTGEDRSRFRDRALTRIDCWKSHWQLGRGGVDNRGRSICYYHFPRSALRRS